MNQQQATRFLVGIDAHIVHGPQEDGWAPGYYSVLFEDPDGIRLEITNFREERRRRLDAWESLPG